MSGEIYKAMCPDCEWRGTSDLLLRAPNPFDSGDIAIGCPSCKALIMPTVACDEPKCWKEASCGTPTPEGYRQTCGAHTP
jgi:hypothetical protein